MKGKKDENRREMKKKEEKSEEKTKMLFLLGWMVSYGWFKRRLYRLSRYCWKPDEESGS